MSRAAAPSPGGPPTVALDATLWDAPTTGTGLYTRELWRALTEVGGVTLERWGASQTGERPRRIASRSLHTLAELPTWLAGPGAPGVYHAVANFNLPLQRPPATRYVLTVHDLIPLALPDTVSRAFRWQFRLWLSRSLALADRVLCVSATTKDDLLARFPEVAERVRVVHNGVDHVAKVPALSATEETYLRSLALPERFALYAGALDARKNVALVLEACARLHRAGRSIPLVLVKQRWFGSGAVEKQVASLQREGLDIRTLGFQPDALFYALIRRSAAFVFPSRYEGFGLPPLEAMWLGVPTVVARAGSLPEVCGDGARYVSPDDADGLALALHELWTDTPAREALAAEGRRQAERFTWSRAAARTLTAYEEAFAASTVRPG